MADYEIGDIGLAEAGRNRINWNEGDMPVLLGIRERFAKERPLKGMRLSVCLHITAKTAALMRTLSAGGAEVVLGEPQFDWEHIPLAMPMDTRDMPVAWDELEHGAGVEAAALGFQRDQQPLDHGDAHHGGREGDQQADQEPPRLGIEGPARRQGPQLLEVNADDGQQCAQLDHDLERLARALEAHEMAQQQHMAR